MTGVKLDATCERSGGSVVLPHPTQLFVVISITAVLFAFPAWPGEVGSCAETVAAEAARLVQARYDDIQDLAADFQQESRSASFAAEPLMTEAKKRGRVIFAKPGRMRWTYSEPDPSLLVSDGQTLWIHDVTERTATRLQVMDGYLTGAALEFLLGNGRLVEEFDVVMTSCSSEAISLDLLPRADASFERLGLVFRPESGELLQTSATDLFGNRTVIEFANTLVNQAPSPSIFEFDPPDGVEVIDLGSANQNQGSIGH